MCASTNCASILLHRAVTSGRAAQKGTRRRDAGGGQIIDVQVLPIQGRSDVAGHFAPFHFVKIGGNHPTMDFLAALGVDRVRDISVKFQTAMAISVLIAHEAVFVEMAKDIDVPLRVRQPETEWQLRLLLFA